MWAKLNDHLAFAAFLGVICALAYWAAVSNQHAKVAPGSIEHEAYLREQTVDCALGVESDLSDQRKLRLCRELVREIDSLHPEARPYPRQSRPDSLSR